MKDYSQLWFLKKQLRLHPAQSSVSLRSQLGRISSDLYKEKLTTNLVRQFITTTINEIIAPINIKVNFPSVYPSILQLREQLVKKRMTLRAPPSMRHIIKINKTQKINVLTYEKRRFSQIIYRGAGALLRIITLDSDFFTYPATVVLTF